MCLYSKLIRNPKYTKTKKNGGIIPPMPDKRVSMVPVGCGKCMECREKTAREWKVRLMEDIKRNKNAKFITLTFSDEWIAKLGREIPEDIKGYERDNAIATLGVRRFCERWRRKYTVSVRHWFVTELGGNGTENIHIHGLLWTDEGSKQIEERWMYGHIWPKDWKQNYVNEGTVQYICKYVSKVDRLHRHYKSKILTSAGIGKGYEVTPQGKLNEYRGERTRDTYVTRQGIKLALPIYYRNKIYSEQERERLWLQKLDKKEIYVLGVRYKTDKPEIYLRAKRAAQKRNEELGFGSCKVNWKQEQYEIQLRQILQETRIQRARRKEPAAWHLEHSATLREIEKEKTEYKDLPPAGFIKRTMDIWEESEKQEAKQNESRIWEEGEYTWKDIWRIDKNNLE